MIKTSSGDVSTSSHTQKLIDLGTGYLLHLVKFYVMHSVLFFSVLPPRADSKVCLQVLGSTTVCERSCDHFSHCWLSLKTSSLKMENKSRDVK